MNQTSNRQPQLFVLDTETRDRIVRFLSDATVHFGTAQRVIIGLETAEPLDPEHMLVEPGLLQLARSTILASVGPVGQGASLIGAIQACRPMQRSDAPAPVPAPEPSESAAAE